jgi:hypothetical protein
MGEKKTDKPDLNAVMEAILQNQQELSDRLGDIEETKHKDGEGSALIKLANIYFNTDDNHITELSFISPLAARPFAEAMALDAMTTEEVRSGIVSLNKLLILNYLRFQRSVRGRLLGIGAEAMREQVSSEGAKGEENMPEYEAGRE